MKIEIKSVGVVIVDVDTNHIGLPCLTALVGSHQASSIRKTMVAHGKTGNNVFLYTVDDVLDRTSNPTSIDFNKNRLTPKGRFNLRALYVLLMDLI